MGETTCLIFVGDTIQIYKGHGRFVLPSEAAVYPIILTNDQATKVIMNSMIICKEARSAMRNCILTAIEAYRVVGIPRIEFPRWNEMILYAVRPEAADEEYWCPEQVVDSFIDLYGPEFII